MTFSTGMLHKCVSASQEKNIFCAEFWIYHFYLIQLHFVSVAADLKKPRNKIKFTVTLSCHTINKCFQINFTRKKYAVHLLVS